MGVGVGVGRSLEGASPDEAVVNGQPYHIRLSGSTDTSAGKPNPGDRHGGEIRKWEKKQMEFFSDMGQGTIICTAILIA